MENKQNIIKSVLNQHGLKARQLEQQSLISASSISAFITNKRDPSTSFKYKIVNALNELIPGKNYSVEDIFPAEKGTIGKLRVGDVFQRTGRPKYTFIEPEEYSKLILLLRERGRGLIIEGPSGIGKTTCVRQVVDELADELPQPVIYLSARIKDEIEELKLLLEQKEIGTLIIDDFHRLSGDTKEKVTNLIKRVADEFNSTNKIVIIGINRIGQTLVNFDDDIIGRIDYVKFKPSSIEKIVDLFTRGENLLNIRFNKKELLATEAAGSFLLAQALAVVVCTLNKLYDEADSDSPVDIDCDIQKTRSQLLDELYRAYESRTKKFATGISLRKHGRYPAMELVRLLGRSDDGVLDISEIIRLSEFVSEPVKYLVEDSDEILKLLKEDSSLSNMIFYDKVSNMLHAEDPKFLYFLRHIDWNRFRKECGFLRQKFTKKYDFALSFSGSVRNVAEAIFKYLKKEHVSVFYDYNEQYRIASEDIREVLSPIYHEESMYVIVLMTGDYISKRWTSFESEIIKSTELKGRLIPILIDGENFSAFDSSANLGGFKISSKSLESDIHEVCTSLLQKISSI